MIQTEEDADNAFQLSSALTQALLDYRMKSINTVRSYMLALFMNDGLSLGNGGSLLIITATH